MIDRACISINNYCNLNCSYCYFYEREDIHTDKLKCFDAGKLKIIIDNIIEYINHFNNTDKKFTIGIVGSGEPLLSFNEIKYAAEYIKSNMYDKRLRLYTISNGYRMDRGIIDFFYENSDLISLSFSLDGFKDLHDRFRVKLINGKYVGSFEKVMESIEYYEEVFGNKPAINCTVFSYTLKFKKQLEEFFLNNKFYNITFSKIFDVSDDLSISYDDFDNFVNSFSNDITIRNIEAAKNKKLDCSMYGAVCGVGITNIFYANKKIYPCGRFTDNDKFVLANYDEPLYKVEEKYKEEIYKKFDEIRYNRISFYDTVKKI